MRGRLLCRLFPQGGIVAGILGIDEAGRGPVIGPLVVAGVLVDAEVENSLIRLGLKDSKQVRRPERRRLAKEIEMHAREIRILAYSPAQLEVNLNHVELSAFAHLVRELSPSRVVVDAPVPPRSIPQFVDLLRRKASTHDELEIVAENRADENHAIASAASIIAKVYRDEALQRLHKLYGDFGWGYPVELKTRSFLRDWYERHRRFPPCVRTRWRTVRQIVQSTPGG